MENICDCCKKAIPETEICYGIEGATLCDACTDEYYQIAPIEGELTTEEKNQAAIEKMSYPELLRIWRHSPSGENELLQGETGTYFRKIMFEKKKKLTQEQRVEASKLVGW